MNGTANVGCDGSAKRWRIEVGDITAFPADAMVTAANSSLSGGGGVDGAIHEAAGPELAEVARKLAPCPPGDAVITPAFRLPARYVIHAVGPVWHGGHEGEDELLSSCYRQAFRLAAAHGVRTIVVPAISTGAYGFPHDRAARLALIEVKHELERSEDPRRPDLLSCITLVLFDESSADVWRQAANEVFPPWTREEA